MYWKPSSNAIKPNAWTGLNSVKHFSLEFTHRHPQWLRPIRWHIVPTCKVHFSSAIRSDCHLERLAREKEMDHFEGTIFSTWNMQCHMNQPLTGLSKGTRPKRFNSDCIVDIKYEQRSILMRTVLYKTKQAFRTECEVTNLRM